MPIARLTATASLLLLTIGCASAKPTALREVTTSEIVPLSNALSTMPAQGVICARVNNQGEIVTQPCPPLLRQLFRYQYRDDAQANGHDYALYKVRVNVLLPAARIHFGQQYANERVWYGGWRLDQTAAALAHIDVRALRELCTVDLAAFDAVVQQVEEGCSRTHFGTKAEAGQAVWSLEALAASGHTIGKGTFLSKHQGEANFTPACEHKAPVAIHLLSREAFCAAYVTPVMMRSLFARVDTLTRQLANTRSALAEARARMQQDRATITRLETQLQVLQQQETASAQQRAALEQQVAALNARNQTLAAQVEKAERQLAAALQALDDARLEIEMMDEQDSAASKRSAAETP